MKSDATAPSEASDIVRAAPESPVKTSDMELMMTVAMAFVPLPRWQMTVHAAELNVIGLGRTPAPPKTIAFAHELMGVFSDRPIHAEPVLYATKGTTTTGSLTANLLTVISLAEL